MDDDKEKTVVGTFGQWAAGKSFEEAKQDCKGYGDAIPAAKQFVENILGDEYEYSINEFEITSDKIWVHCDVHSGRKEIKYIYDMQFRLDMQGGRSSYAAHGYLRINENELNCSVDEFIDQVMRETETYDEFDCEEDIDADEDGTYLIHCELRSDDEFDDEVVPIEVLENRFESWIEAMNDDDYKK